MKLCVRRLWFFPRISHSTGRPFFLLHAEQHWPKLARDAGETYPRAKSTKQFRVSGSLRARTRRAAVAYLCRADHFLTFLHQVCKGAACSASSIFRSSINFSVGYLARLNKFTVAAVQRPVVRQQRAFGGRTAVYNPACSSVSRATPHLQGAD